MRNIQILEAQPKDLNEIKGLMLQALQTDPKAFSSDYSDYANNSNEWWNNYLFGYLYKHNAKMLIAQNDNKLVGMIGVLYDTKKRRKHVASIVWFFVESNFRKEGIGKRLLTSMIEDIKMVPYIKKINLLVNAPQEKAISIYKSFGFKISGTLRQELLINDEFIDEHIMELFI